MTETTESQISSLILRVEEQGVEIAQMRRALLSLGSHAVAGGLPGPKGYLLWHNDQIQNLPAPALAPQPTAQDFLSERIAQLEAQLAEAKAALNPPGLPGDVPPPSVKPPVTFSAPPSGTSTAGSPPTSPGSTAAAGSASAGSAPPSTAAPASK